jgi:CheY-like chemotaxis protein
MRRRLLLVEDAPDVALVVGHLGRRLGLEVAHRSDVASAWDYLQGGVRPDLILLDLNLPGERGEALCRRLRSSPATADLRVALFAHWSCPEDIVSGLEAGADYVVAKDLLARPDEWAARLSDILLRGVGLPPPHSLYWEGHDFPPHAPLEGIEALNRALRHPLVRQLGSDVARFVLRRAVRRAGVGDPDAGRWLQPDGLSLDARHVATAVPCGAVAALVVAVTEQLERLLGTEAAAPAREALRAAAARLER